MANIGVDLDQVLADFSAAFDAYHDKHYGSNLLLEPAKEFYLRNIFDISEEEELRRVKEFYDTKYFLAIKPFSDSIDIIEALSKKHNLYIITSRPSSITKETSDWIKKYYKGFFKEIILTNHYFGGTKKKSEVCIEKNITWMIEDMANYANDCAEAGVKVILIERPWNIKEKVHKNVKRVKDWFDISKNNW